MTATDGQGYAPVRTPGGDQLRERLRQVLARFIDPDDDTMPALDRDDSFTWVPAESVLDDLMKVVDPLARMYLQAMAELGRAVDRLDSTEKT
ncbi:hypothetical protein [Streptomyces cadmiisoli]|uniref:hypothetical protein n=1 Tax=Streptomyces cadmiisoli TaxID=2184053 RepID=UPI003669D4C2